MKQEEYIEVRVDDQIEYYDTQSGIGQSRYKWLAGTQMLSGAVIPIIAGFSDSICFSEWIIALLGLTVTSATAFLTINKYQERWINFRTTCETLKHLKYLFVTESSPYNDGDSYDKFVNDIEAVLSKENTDWAFYARMQKEKDEDGSN